MDDVKKILDGWMLDQGLKTYKELAEFLGVSPATLDMWKQRGKIPEKNVMRYVRASNYAEHVDGDQVGGDKVGSSKAGDKCKNIEKNLVDSFVFVAELAAKQNKTQEFEELIKKFGKEIW